MTKSDQKNKKGHSNKPISQSNHKNNNNENNNNNNGKPFINKSDFVVTQSILNSSTFGVDSSNIHPKKDSVLYGELVVLGYNGDVPVENTPGAFKSSRRQSKFVLKKRDKANGVKPFSQHNCESEKQLSGVLKNDYHSVSYTLSRNQTVVVQYERDNTIDMFQIGRSSELPIDFIVLDTPAQTNLDNPNQSTISRFSCRICVEREPPYTARIYAAGFDSSKHIFLGEKAPKWNDNKNEMDGLTTNGILIMHPSKGFERDSKCSQWLEVSVCGAVFKLTEDRSKARFNNETSASNILQDGTIIDLCGATLVWRSRESLSNTISKDDLRKYFQMLSSSKPTCPVGLKTLAFPSLSALQQKFEEDRIPMVYLECGHVHGPWDMKNINNDSKCTLCRKNSRYVKLQFGLEPSLFCDTDINDMINKYEPHAFRPCAHMASESTCKFWSKMLVPQGTTEGLAAVCPFCATPLCKEQPFIKLIFQDKL